jgi:hypothetical protein
MYLFLDDERIPEQVFWKQLPQEEYVIVRTYEEFVDTISKEGCPRFISFDHDLGHLTESGYAAAKWLCNADMDKVITIPKDFKFLVHSMNPVGARMIESYLNAYLAQR